MVVGRKIIEIVEKSGLYPEKQAIVAEIMMDYIASPAGVKFEEKIYKLLFACEKNELNSTKILKLINHALAAPIRQGGKK
jgi:hypothetical protein